MVTTDLMLETGRFPPQTLIWLFGGLTGALVTILCHLMLLPSDPTPQLFPQQDKVAHFIAFGAITGPGILILPRRYMGFIAGIAITLAAGVEIVQGVSGTSRQASIPDFIAGVIGVAVACWIGRWIVRRFLSGTSGLIA